MDCMTSTSKSSSQLGAQTCKLDDHQNRLKSTRMAQILTAKSYLQALLKSMPVGWVGWHVSLSPVLRRPRQVDIGELVASLVDIRISNV